MSNRLDQEREARLQPERMKVAVEKLTAIGKEIVFRDETRLEFLHNGSRIIFFPYSGWHSGKTITDGRGLTKLLRQLK